MKKVIWVVVQGYEPDEACAAFLSQKAMAYIKKRNVHAKPNSYVDRFWLMETTIEDWPE